MAAADVNPFVRYRDRLDVHRRWIELGRGDDEFVDLVVALDADIAAVEGRAGAPGFAITPVAEQPALATAIGLARGARLTVKDETSNVSGSHKARHLFGLALHAAVDEAAGAGATGELVIASCGNAALGAAVVARAARRALRVFIPTWADDGIAAELERLGAAVERCPRRPGEVGDPCYLRFREAVDAGAVPFSVQGIDVPRSLDGGRTIGWELAEQLAARDGARARLDRVYVQVGGGALGTCLAAGIADGVARGDLASMPRVHGVQTEACAPLARAWDRLHAEPDPVAALADAEVHADRFMQPWDPVGTSAATGILDDVTYDWVELTRHMLASGGSPVVVDEATVGRANELARAITAIDVDATGTAGLAGLMADVGAVGADEHVAVLFTGRRR